MNIYRFQEQAFVNPLTPVAYEKGRTYLNKPASENRRFVKYVWPFTGHQALIKG